MSTTAEQPSTAGRRRRGLNRISSEQLGKASDETATQVNRIGVTFLGTTAFCLLSLLSPDSALLGGNEKINVPLQQTASRLGRRFERSIRLDRHGGRRGAIHAFCWSQYRRAWMAGLRRP